ncbi:MAG: hypothetical protein K8T91_15220 [Planctomycetes bacterium]|nr:hypothetical protein [Planctomycetota bacterium]
MSRLNCHLAACFSLWVLVISLCGCEKPKVAVQAPLPSDEKLKAMLDEELNYTYTKRYLNLTDHAAWQIMHGVVPFGTNFQVYDNDRLVNALNWVLDGHTMKGWTPQHGDDLAGRQGLKMLIEAGKFGQGHPEQWLSILGQSGIKSDHKLIFDGHDYQVRDLMQQALWDLYEGKEASWTLTSALIYLGPDAKWTSSDGQEWTVERVVAMEAAQDLSTSACGGTHRLTALNRAARTYRKEHGEPKGGWAAAEKKVRDAIETARRFQQPDGALSNNFFTRPGASADNVAMMYSTGHTVEFLAMSVNDEELDAPWMKKAVVKLCELFHNTRAIDVECGSLYHAVNGLKKYRERKFGPWTPPGHEATAEAHKTAGSAAPAVASQPAKDDVKKPTSEKATDKDSSEKVAPQTDSADKKQNGTSKK